PNPVPEYREREPGAFTVVYSTPADRFDNLMTRLAITVASVALFSMGLIALVAMKVSRVALRPLHETATAIGQIDERRLDRRIDPRKLPDELVPMAERLNAMLARLERVFTQRRRFLADAAHELRTPVAALLTTMEVALRRPREAAALTTTLNDCLSDARLLRTLVETLLEQARSEAGPGAHEVQTVDLSTLLDACCDVTDTAGRVRNIVVERGYAPGLRFRTEPTRLRSIVTNLLTNAVEYNRPDGAVRLTCELGGAGDELRLSVTDQGVGIGPEHLPHIFEPFYRGHSPSRTDGQHRGLGLFLVRSHLDALSGRCEVDSKVDDGTVFHITLPQSPEPAASLPQATMGTSPNLSTHSAPRPSTMAKGVGA
ncbi:MAG: sensor histidine kinase, partial [Tepidisphaeraceae bacterium]